MATFPPAFASACTHVVIPAVVSQHRDRLSPADRQSNIPQIFASAYSRRYGDERSRLSGPSLWLLKTSDNQISPLPSNPSPMPVRVALR